VVHSYLGPEPQTPRRGAPPPDPRTPILVAPISLLKRAAHGMPHARLLSAGLMVMVLLVKAYNG